MQEHPVDVKGGSPNPVVLAILLAVLMGVIELPFAAFMADDFIQLGILEHVSPCTWIGPTNLYTISDGDPVHVGIMKNAGAFPWFFGREFKMAFFRPLSSALLALDHVFFGLNPVGYRIHGILWFLLLVLGFGSLLRSILPESLTRLALIVFTISGIHGILCWTATRHIVIAAAVCMLGVSCHVRWRAGGWRPGRFLSIACFALSLTASEAAIGMVIYLLAYEAFGAPGRRKECLKACLPITVVISLYLVLYALFKFGASGGSGYINPLQEPLTFLIQLPVRLVVLMGAMLAGGNADLWVLRPHLRPVMFGAGMFFVAVFAMLLRAVWARISTEERQAARWLTAGSLASAIPFTGTPIGSRCLVVPFIGGSVVIALVLHYWWKERRRSCSPRRPIPSRWAATWRCDSGGGRSSGYW